MKNVDLAIDIIQDKIYLLRGRKVMFDHDLAELYGVKTFRLNEAVKRNLRRFPHDFMFRLNNEEKRQVIANCDHLSRLKFSPHNPLAFTEQGVAMLSSVLNSERAVQVNIAIMRAFVKLREELSATKELAIKLSELEKKIEKHDTEITTIFDAIRRLMAVPDNPRNRIGFITDK